VNPKALTDICRVGKLSEEQFIAWMKERVAELVLQLRQQKAELALELRQQKRDERAQNCRGQYMHPRGDVPHFRWYEWDQIERNRAECSAVGITLPSLKDLCEALIRAFKELKEGDVRGGAILSDQLWEGRERCRQIGIALPQIRKEPEELAREAEQLMKQQREEARKDAAPRREFDQVQRQAIIRIEALKKVESEIQRRTFVWRLAPSSKKTRYSLLVTCYHEVMTFSYDNLKIFGELDRRRKLCHEAGVDFPW
jgi:hypothetical protein